MPISRLILVSMLAGSNLLISCGTSDPTSGILGDSGGDRNTSFPESTSVERTSGPDVEEVEYDPYQPDLDLLLDRFLNTAAYYGYEVDPTFLSQLQMELFDGLPAEDQPEGDGVVLGVCYYTKYLIQLLPPGKFPGEIPSPIRYERIAFHELGHCLLRLPHTDQDVVIEHFGRVIEFPKEKRVMYWNDTLDNIDIDDAYWRHSKRVLFDYGKAVQNGELPDIESSAAISTDMHGCRILQ